MKAKRLRPGSPTLGRYLGVAVLDVLGVVRGERVLDYLMFYKLHVPTFVEECIMIIYSVQHYPTYFASIMYNENAVVNPTPLKFMTGSSI
jgi:hypothetical protein